MSFELEFLKMLRNISNNILDFIFEVITFLGEQYVLIAIVVLLYFALDKKKTEKLIYAVFVSLLLNGFIKLLVQRTRPFVKDPSIIPAREHTATGYSFPSGHTQNAAVTYTSIGLFFKRKIVWIIVTILIFLIGFSRLWLGVHYPTDVIAGALLGIGCSFGGLYLIEKVGTTPKKRLVLYLMTILFFTPFIIWFYVRMPNMENSYILYKDMFISYGLVWGFIGAVFIENRFVQFEDTPILKMKVLRCIGALISIGIAYFVLSFIFKAINETSVILDCLRYGIVAFIGFGIYPLVFKKLLFKN